MKPVWPPFSVLDRRFQAVGDKVDSGVLAMGWHSRRLRDAEGIETDFEMYAVLVDCLDKFGSLSSSFARAVFVSGRVVMRLASVLVTGLWILRVVVASEVRRD